MKKSLLKKASIIAVATMLMAFNFVTSGVTFAATNLGSKIYENRYELAPGVSLKKENFQNNNIRRAINYVQVDLNTASLSTQIAFGQPFNNLTRITDLAHRETQVGSRYVVGTINAAFFLTNGSGLPANLVVQNNEILRLGGLSATPNDPIFYRNAFGINANGKPRIDSYQENMQMTHKGKSVPINMINAVRRADQLILYTPTLGYNVPTIDNNFSTEIVVTNASKNTSTLSFGDVITGTVSAVSRNNRGASSQIPQDGFVLAANGQGLAKQLEGIQVGDEITVSISIDQKWMNSQTMIATGPLLVKDGKVSISMNESSSFASARHPRSAVGLTRDNKMIMVTVDGRQAGYSDGISLRDLAQYLISLGAVAAINLDGGGSTAMAARLAGHDYAYLINRPSEAERRVTNAIQIVSTVPPKQVTVPMVELDRFNHLNNWFSSVLRGSGGITLSSANEPVKAGNRSVKLTYDFTASKEKGTSAAYLIARQPLLLEGKPKKIGMWVHGDGNENWLRLQVSDRNRKTHYIDVTEENKLNWSGWRYVTANISNNLQTPISIERVYIAQTKEDKKKKGTIFIDKLEAIYDENYQIPSQPVPGRFSDVWSNYWAIKEINSLVDQEVITGFPDGSFRPELSITREQVAMMLVRQLKLDTANPKNPEFIDVKTTDNSYKAIATVAELGLLTGRRAGYFDPKKQLTRAEAAVILQRAYDLDGGENLSFPDVTSPQWDWAYTSIQALAANKVTTGYTDGTFGPSHSVTRAQFAAFLYRINTK